VLPSGWVFKDPKDGDRPWRAQRVRSGVALTVEAESREAVIESAVAIDAGFAAVIRPEQGWVPRGGFVP
jgi:hypothetical protein